MDLFEPREFEFEYKVIVTNKETSTKNVLQFHNGRGSQEGLIGELKSCVHFDYIVCRRQIANKHILGRELQMQAMKKDRGLGLNRPALWSFKKLSTLRQQFLFRAGKITRPAGKLTLTMSDNRVVRKEMNKYLGVLAV